MKTVSDELAWEAALATKSNDPRSSTWWTEKRLLAVNPLTKKCLGIHTHPHTKLIITKEQ